MLAPLTGTKPTTECVERAVKTRPWRTYTMPDGSRQRHYEYRGVYAAIHGWSAIAGRHVEHACDNGKCVRYSHLRLGSYMTNNQDTVAKGRHWQTKKTGCPRGHEYDGVDILGRRFCKQCAAENVRRCRARKRGS